MQGTESAFDRSAEKYDEEFTNSSIGRMQRNRVWNYLNTKINPQEFPRVLELNCGTGEDAKWLASKGFQVTATDQSRNMTEHAARKVQAAKLHADFQVCSFEEINNRFVAGSFDLIFSNFGGLNCIDEAALRLLGEELSLLLRPGGRFIAVVMSDDCTLERWYFKRKNMEAEANRRKKAGGVTTTIEGATFTTHYYSPEQFAKIMSNVFLVQAQKAVGWTIPPSYTENYFRTKPFLLKALNAFENTFGNSAGLAKKADHFLIDFVKK